MRQEDELSVEDFRDLVKLDRQLRRIPLLPQQRMPTRLGNVLRSAESRPARKYGLDGAVRWPQLWLVLPDSTRGEVAEARSRLNQAAAGTVWGTLLLIWTVWTWSAPVAAVIAACVCYLALLLVATSYTDLIEAAWDLHRTLLYRALRWPLPETRHQPPNTGQAWRSPPTCAAARMG